MTGTQPEPPQESDPLAQPPEWWEDPSLPWKHKPNRSDLACMAWLSAAGLYGVVMLFARPALLASAPHVLASLGSWSGSILIGAKAALGDPWWPLVWILGTIGLVKFDWVYWWAGKLWGRDLIDVWSGRSERARRANQRAERLTRKYETWAIVIAMLPIPLPRAVVLAVLGEAGTSLRKLMVVSLSSSFVMMGVYLAIGYWIGEPAVALVDTYGRYLWYASLALLVGVLANAWWKGRSANA
ncbi:MAG: VTT domain-containing protein [Propionicimonas sp.]|nr:VTT domain-containing protein [Propionicimonas sp.]